MTWGWTHISSPQWSPTESKTNYVEKPSIQIQNSRASCRQLELAMLNILGWAPSSAGFYWHVWFSLFCKSCREQACFKHMVSMYNVQNKPNSRNLKKHRKHFTLRKRLQDM